MFYSARSFRSQEINNIRKVDPQAFSVAMGIQMQIDYKGFYVYSQSSLEKLRFVVVCCIYTPISLKRRENKSFHFYWLSEVQYIKKVTTYRSVNLNVANQTSMEMFVSMCDSHYQAEHPTNTPFWFGTAGYCFNGLLCRTYCTPSSGVVVDCNPLHSPYSSKREGETTRNQRNVNRPVYRQCLVCTFWATVI